MEFHEVIERRRSIREYTDEPIDPSVLERILYVVGRAPSAGNLQAYRVDVVRTAARRRALSEAAEGQDFVARAAVDLVFFADPDRSAAVYGRRGSSLYAVQDATIAAAYAQLAATNEGLASAWVGTFDDRKVSAVCDERKLRPVAIIPIGYGSEDPRPTSRRPLPEVVRDL